MKLEPPVRLRARSFRKALALTFGASVRLATLQAQEHLIPEEGLLTAYDPYHFKVRNTFAAAFTQEVVCMVVIFESFALEQVVGVRKVANGYEVFRMTASSSIWAAYLRPRGSDKKQSPEASEKITCNVKAVAVEEALALRASSTWEQMLLATRYPKEARIGEDGTAYHFSMWVRGRGIICGQVWSPDEKSKTAALVNLVGMLSDYATGRADAESLKNTLNAVERVTKG